MYVLFCRACKITTVTPWSQPHPTYYNDRCQAQVSTHIPTITMARLRFGTDARGKEILELMPPLQPTKPTSSERTSSTMDGAAICEGGETCPPKGKQAKDVELAGTSSIPYKGENTIVMMEWEKPYMRALVDALGITGEKRPDQVIGVNTRRLGTGYRSAVKKPATLGVSTIQTDGRTGRTCTCMCCWMLFSR